MAEDMEVEPPVVDMEPSVVDATPAPSPDDPSPQTTTSTTTLIQEVLVGSLEFSMGADEAAAVVEAFEDPDRRAEVSSAFATALAGGLGVDPSDVEITQLALAERRLGSRERRLTNATGGLTAEYEIRVPEGAGEAMVETLTSLDEAALSEIS